MVCHVLVISKRDVVSVFATRNIDRAPFNRPAAAGPALTPKEIDVMLTLETIRLAIELTHHLT